MDEPLVTETRFLRLDLPPEGLRLEKGGVLPRVDVAYETCGTLSPAKDTVVFICHALTGDAHVAGIHRGDRKPTGWWFDMVRPGGGIDTDKYFVVCANILGGCMGTTGPSSVDPRTGRPYGSAFPEITVGDIVAFGDSLNDIPMLTAAGRSVAVANAWKEVQAASDEVCASNNEDGVARWLASHYLPGEVIQ